MQLNINTDAAVTFTNDLEKMSRSALPNAIRNTLNSAAFDVKKNTMPKSAAREFVQRKPNFFKANSKVEMASGFNIDSMKAVVGFIPSGGRGADQAVDDLEEQEYGGTIEGRSFIPMDPARTGGNAKPVRPSNRLSQIKNIVNANTIEGKTPKQQFLHAVSKAGVGGYVLGNNANQTLFRVESIERGNIRLRAVFSYEKGRDVQIKETAFMREASTESANKLDDFYIIEAEKQFDKHFKRSNWV